jgi:hemolysin III
LPDSSCFGQGPRGAEIASAIVFGLGMIFLYTMSALYHALPRDGKAKRVFKRFDHISIYVLIGATFAPIFIMVIPKPMGWILLAVQWAIIVLGSSLKPSRSTSSSLST